MRHSPASITRLASRTAVLCALLAQGCLLGPSYKRPEMPSPATWAEGAGAPVQPGGAATASSQAPQPSWWLSFGDPELAALVERAVQATPKVREAAARVREARAMRTIAGADLWPKLDLSGSYTDSRISEHGFLQGFGTPSNNGAPSLPGAIIPGQSIDLYQTGFDAQWEIDLFGHVRRSAEAASAQQQAAEAGYRETLLSLAAETAREVIELRTTDTRLAVAQSTVAAQSDTLDVVRQRYAAGISNALEMARAEARLASVQASVPALRSRRSGTLRRLEVLVAAPTGSLDKEFSSAHEIPGTPRFVDAGLPSELLLRRPDVGRAERELAAATARIGVARAELLPRFSLTGSFGFQSQETGNLFTSDSRFWLIGPGMRWPIFDAGRLLANVEVQNARTEQAAARYENAVRSALADVETAMSALEGERGRTEALERAAAAERRGTEVAHELFTGGVVEFLEVLDAERSLYRAEEELAISRGLAAADAVALYKALAGGWPTPDVAVPTKAGAPDQPEGNVTKAGASVPTK